MPHFEKIAKNRNIYILLQTYCITMDSGQPDFENPVTFDTTQGNTTVSLTTTPAEKQGIIDVLFFLDDNLIESIANTFWDGKLEVDPETGTKKIMPNSEYYKCPVCGTVKNIHKDRTYRFCEGTPEHKHEFTFTEPVDWHPLASRTGLSFIFGQLQANINSNIQTGNYGKSSADVAANASLDQRLINAATNVAISIVGGFLSNVNNYADWLVQDPELKLLPQVFNVPFLTSIMTSLSMNILAAYSKGKNMAAVEKIMEARAVIEQKQTSVSERSELAHTESAHKPLIDFGSIFSRPQK